MKALLITLLIPIFVEAKKASDWMWEVVKIIPKKDQNTEAPVGDTVYFRNAESINDAGFQLQFIEKVSARRGLPLIVFKGVTCFGCDVSPSLLVYSIKDKSVVEVPLPQKKKNDEVKIFKGECVDRVSDQLIVYTHLQVDETHWDDKFQIIRSIQGQHSEEIKSEPKIIEKLLKLSAKAKGCRALNP